MANITEQIMQYSIKNKASDIHLGENCEPTVRLNGNLVKISNKITITKDDIEYLIRQYSNEEDIAKFYEKGFLDISYEFERTRFRANFYITRQQAAVALRLIPTVIPPIEGLNLPAAVKGILGLKNGLVLVTGATGSGKSTTIASIVNEINKLKAEHIITIEDPVEFVYDDIKSLIHQREVGTDVKSFNDAIMCALREDPDIIVLGEIRTHESISSALTLAETGHLVFATLHTKSAAESVDRIIDVFPSDQQSQIRVQLSNCLKYVIAQTLIPSVDRRGRLPLIELMVVNQAISSAIVSKAPLGTLRDQISLNQKKLGSQTFSQCAQDFLNRGLVNPEVVKTFIDPNPTDNK